MIAVVEPEDGGDDLDVLGIEVRSSGVYLMTDEGGHEPTDED